MTREEAKKRLEVWMICVNCPEDKMCYDSHLHSICEYTDYCDEVPIEEAVKVAIKALEQEPKADVLDKIKAEIEQMPSELTADGRRMIRRGSVFRIIDKYKAESEGV